jgi:hypothetical protein
MWKRKVLGSIPNRGLHTGRCSNIQEDVQIYRKMFKYTGRCSMTRAIEHLPVYSKNMQVKSVGPNVLSLGGWLSKRRGTKSSENSSS